MGFVAIVAAAFDYIAWLVYVLAQHVFFPEHNCSTINGTVVTDASIAVSLLADCIAFSDEHLILLNL
jgi:hypothetical protein